MPLGDAIGLPATRLFTRSGVAFPKPASLLFLCCSGRVREYEQSQAAVPVARLTPTDAPPARPNRLSSPAYGMGVVTVEIFQLGGDVLSYPFGRHF